MNEITFLFDTHLISEVEALIKNSNKELLLISPFIDLDHRIKDALRSKINKKDFKLRVLFGKNEKNIYKSIKQDSIDFLKTFPDVEIRYNERLHAKFYRNDYDFIVTSLNLYDYSLANNIEVGVQSTFAARGYVRKVVRVIAGLINKLLEVFDQKFLGYEYEDDPIEKFDRIFYNSELKYKTQPIISAKDGFMGALGVTELKGKEVEKDELIKKPVDKKVKKPTSLKKNREEVSSKLSISKLSKKTGVKPDEILKIMENVGYIKAKEITSLGFSKGLIEKKYMGKKYIAYPADLKEIIGTSN
jgi:hypothetical protein